MHHTVFAVVARDLTYDETGAVVPGPDTARVCNDAAWRCKFLNGSRIAVMAGWSSKYGVIMGDVMRTYLVEKCGVSPDRILQTVAKHFDTNGEMDALAKLLRRYPDETKKNDTYCVYVIASWWHALRAWNLLVARLEPWQHAQVRVRAVEVESNRLSPLLLKDLVREYLLAWPKNFFFGRFFSWHRLYTCQSCYHPDCYEIGRNEHCHRCGHVEELVRVCVPA